MRAKHMDMLSVGEIFAIDAGFEIARALSTLSDHSVACGQQHQ